MSDSSVISRHAATLVEDHPRAGVAGLPRLTWVVYALLDKVDEYLRGNQRYGHVGRREMMRLRVAAAHPGAPPLPADSWFVEIFGRHPLPGEEEELAIYDSSRPNLTGGQLLEALGVVRVTYAANPRFLVLPPAFHLSRLLPALGFYLARMRSGGVSHAEVLESMDSYLPHDPPQTLGTPGQTVVDNPVLFLRWYSKELGRFLEDCLSKRGYWRERAPRALTPADIPDLDPLPSRGVRASVSTRSLMPPPPVPNAWGSAARQGGDVPPPRLLPHARQETVDNSLTTDDDRVD